MSDIRISQSEIELFRACEWNWYFSQYLGYTFPGGEIGGALGFGSALHEGLEAFYKGDDPLNRIGAYYREIEIPDEKKQLAIEERNLAYQVMEAYMDYWSPEQDREDFGEIESVEGKMEVPAKVLGEDVLLIGKADLITERGSADHKTAKTIKSGLKASFYPRHQGRFYLWLLWEQTGRFRGEFSYNMIKRGVRTERCKPETIFFSREHLYYSAPELQGFRKSVQLTLERIVKARRRLSLGEDFRDVLIPSYDPTSYRTNIFLEHYPSFWEGISKQDWQDRFNEQYVKIDPLERYKTK